MERFKATKRDVMKLSYIEFILLSADCPSPDYNSKKEKKNKNRPQTAQDEINAISQALG